MAKAAAVFACNSCGSSFPKWLGRCPDCGGWNTLESAGGARASPGGKRLSADVMAHPARPLSEVSGAPEGDTGPGGRLRTGIGEFDRVLGGGLTPASAVLLGGDPGVGKSTLMLQAALGWAGQGERVLYAACEESASQVRRRADRLLASAAESKDNADSASALDIPPQAPPDDLLVCPETRLGVLLEQARQARPAVVVVDSIQMIDASEASTTSGAVAQLRTATLGLIRGGKELGFALMLIGHVTKSGGLAGPKLIEHMVDAVLRFDGDRYHAHRVLRAVKNRFGATHEIGLFEMTGGGLREAADGAGLLADEYQPRPGSVAAPVMQGTRCLMVEVQALTASGFLGSAKRKVSGLDSSRLAMLIAVLERHGGLRLADQDVFASSVGGVRAVEPACDLALALAIAGAFLGRSLPERTAAVGEIGLGGEVRPGPQTERRAAEARRLGFERILGPPVRRGASGAGWTGVSTIGQAMEMLT
ncbi:MAG: DNA repair protein RadA [Planctomycetota bacterium]